MFSITDFFHLCVYTPQIASEPLMECFDKGSKQHVPVFHYYVHVANNNLQVTATIIK